MPDPTLIERFRHLADKSGAGMYAQIMKPHLREAADTLERYEREREALLSEKMIDTLASYRYAIGGTGVRYEDLPDCPTKRRYHDAAKRDLEQVKAALQHAQEEVGEDG